MNIKDHISGDKDAMRSKRRASNINPKKWTEESDDVSKDVLQILGNSLVSILKKESCLANNSSSEIQSQ